jgi:PAS domain S-box-containing protein
MAFRNIAAVGACLFPGVALLGWALLVHLPREARQQDDALRLAHLVAAEQVQRLNGIHDTLNVVSLSRRLDEDPAACNAYLAQVVESNSLLVNASRVETDGTIRCSAKPAPPGLNVSGDDFFRQVLSSRNFAVSGYRVGAITHRQQIAATLPVLDHDSGQVRFFVGAAVDLGSLERSLAGLSMPDGATLSILDADGIVLVRKPALPDAIGKPMPELAALRQISGDTGTMEGRSGRRFVGWVPIGAGGGRASVVVTIEAGTSTTTLVELAVLIMLAGALLAGAMLLVTWRDILWRTGARRAYTTSVVGVVLFLGAGAGATVRLFYLESERTQGMERTHRTIDELAAASTDLVRAGTGETAYQLRGSGDDVLLALSAARDLARRLARVSDLVEGKTQQEGRVARLRAMVEQLMVDLRAQAGAGPAGRGAQPEFERLRRDADDLLEKVIGEEQQSLVAQRADGRVAERQAMVLSALIAAAALMLLMSGARVILDQAHANAGAKEMLADSERRYRMFAENMRDLIVVVDLKGVRKYVSPAAYSLYGVHPEELLGTRSVEMAHPEDAPKLLQAFRELASGEKETASVLVRGRHRSGEYRWIEINVQLVRDPVTNAPFELVGVLRDSNDRVLAEQALRKSEEQFRLITENAGDLIVSVGPDGRRRYVSPSYERVLGYKPEELINLPRASFFHEEDRARVAASFDSMFTENPIPFVRGRGLHKDGHVVWLEAHHTLVRDPATGEPIESVSIMRDITAQKKAAEQLEEARREAERANRVKSEFLASMSHEIRTPMNGVIGFSTLLLETTLTEGQKRLVTLLMESGDALLAIINDILDYSKIEAGRLELEAIPVNLREIINGACAMVEPQARAKGLDLRTRIESSVPHWVRADPTRLRQVLLNFLSNAIKFTFDGGILVSIEREESATGRLMFKVQDTGVGMILEQQQSLFQPFSQVDSSTTRKFGGTGLGLAISKRLVEAMPQGQIGVMSTPEVGSTFWFAAALPETGMVVVAEDRPEPAAFRPAHILVVEDTAINRVIVDTMLKQAGHTVTLTNDGVQAIDALHKENFDLVLMDMQMPVMDGLEATRRIRAGEAGRPDIPIVALTAAVLPSEVERCMQAGMSDFLPKPIVLDALLRTVAKWVN